MKYRSAIVIFVIVSFVAGAAAIYWWASISDTFYGKVVDPTGNPVSGANVHVVAHIIPLFAVKQTGLEGSGYQTSYDVITDNSGIFKISGRHRDLMVTTIKAGQLRFDVYHKKYSFRGDEIGATSASDPATFSLTK